MIESKYFYGIRIEKVGFPAFLARCNASAPHLFWFHEDAIKYIEYLRKEKPKSKPSRECLKCIPEKLDIVRVFVRWNTNGKTYNTSGNVFRSKDKLHLTRKKNA